MDVKRDLIKRWLGAALALALLVPAFSQAASAEGTAAAGTKDEFLAAVQGGGITEIQLTADVDLTGINVIDISGLTLDLCGHTISANNFTCIFEGSDFVIKNGTMKANSNGGYALFIGDGPTDNVLIQDLITVGGINIYNSSNVTLKDVDVTSTNYYAVWCDEGGQCSVESGTFRTDGVAVLGMAEGDFGSLLEISGGDFVTNGKPIVLDDGKDRNPPVIYGGSFDCPVREYLDESLQYEVNNDGIYTYYSTFDDAADGAEDGGKITPVTSTDGAFEATLNYGDDSGKTVILTADADGNIVLPSADRSGYIFLGWTPEGSSEPIEAGETYALTGDTVFTGAWKQLTYSKVEAKAPSCEEPGNIEYWVCNELPDLYFKDEACTEPITPEETVIPATGHDPVAEGAEPATCTEEGYTGDTVCKTCGKVIEKGETIPMIPHDYKDGYCTVCGTADPDYIPETTPPQTGYGSYTALWAVLLLASGAGVAAAAAVGKKRRDAR